MPHFKLASQLLKENIWNVVDIWLEALQNRPQFELTKTLPKQEAIATIPSLINAVASAIDNKEQLDNFSPGGANYQQAVELGRFRLLQGYSVSHVISECNLLQRRIEALLCNPTLKPKLDISPVKERIDWCFNQILSATVEGYLEAHIEKLERVTRFDQLTGLYNQQVFTKELEEELRRAKRLCYPLSLLLLSIDNFKQYNDQYGQEEGNTALQEIAKMVISSSRAIDKKARCGGEEFGVICLKVAKKQAVSVGERIRQIIKEQTQNLPGFKKPLTASIGLAVYPHDSDSPQNLLQIARTTLVQTKREESSPN